MQNTDHRPSLLLFVFHLGLVSACYAHPGQPHDDDPQLWEKHAIEACERGDTRAFRAFVERADLDEDSTHCVKPDHVHDNTPSSGD